MDLAGAKAEVKYRNGGVRMERIPRAVYRRELREEAAKLVGEGGWEVIDRAPDGGQERQAVRCREAAESL
jgi:hypothetical protein